METVSSSQVKEAVARDLKQQHITQKFAAKLIGFTPQAFSHLLSRDSYFTEKQAILFSLAFGYEKEFLMKGEGDLSSVKEIVDDNPAEISIGVKVYCNHDFAILVAVKYFKEKKTVAIIEQPKSRWTLTESFGSDDRAHIRGDYPFIAVVLDGDISDNTPLGDHWEIFCYKP